MLRLAAVPGIDATVALSIVARGRGLHPLPHWPTSDSSRGCASPVGEPEASHGRIAEADSAQGTVVLVEAAWSASKALLARRGFDPVLGARPLRRTIQREIDDQLSEKILFGEVERGQIVVVDLVEPSPASSTIRARCTARPNPEARTQERSVDLSLPRTSRRSVVCMWITRPGSHLRVLLHDHSARGNSVKGGAEVKVRIGQGPMPCSVS